MRDGEILPLQNLNPWADCNRIRQNWLCPREDLLNQIRYKSIHWGGSGQLEYKGFVPCLFVCLLVRLFVYLCIYLCMYVCMYLFIYVFIHLFTRSSVRPSVRPSIHPSIHPFIHPSLLSLSPPTVAGWNEYLNYLNITSIYLTWMIHYVMYGKSQMVFVCGIWGYSWFYTELQPWTIYQAGGVNMHIAWYTSQYP